MKLIRHAASPFADWSIQDDEGGILATISETVDNTYMITECGIQWGPEGEPRDRSGCAGTTWETPDAAFRAYRDSFNGEG